MKHNYIPSWLLALGYEVIIVLPILH